MPRAGSSRRRRVSSPRSSERATTRSTKPWLNRNSARWNPSGSSAAIVPAVTRAPANPMSASGSATFTSPTAANEAKTPPVVGSDRIEMNGTPAARSRSSAASVLASCISASVPSCIRAPPEALTMSSGTRAARACSAARVTFSPTTAPIEPPMNPKSMTHSGDLGAADRAGPPDGGVAHAGRQLGGGAGGRDRASGRRTRGHRPTGGPGSRSAHEPGSRRWSRRASADSRKWCPQVVQTRRFFSSCLLNSIVEQVGHLVHRSGG